jgi:hypothetical protein
MLKKIIELKSFVAVASIFICFVVNSAYASHKNNSFKGLVGFVKKNQKSSLFIIVVSFLLATAYKKGWILKKEDEKDFSRKNELEIFNLINNKKNLNDKEKVIKLFRFIFNNKDVLNFEPLSVKNLEELYSVFGYKYSSEEFNGKLKDLKEKGEAKLKDINDLNILMGQSIVYDLIKEKYFEQGEIFPKKQIRNS